MTRGRKRSIVPSVALNLALPEDWRVRVDLLLHSEFEGRVPKGAYQRFFLERLVDFFETQALDLGPYLGTLPGEASVRGRPTAVAKLETHLRSINAGETSPPEVSA